MGQYRQSRNVEATLVDYIVEQLALASFTDVGVTKSFAKIPELPIPCICVRVQDTIHNKVEVGSTSTTRNVDVLIDVVASSDGQRLDLKDFLVAVLKNGMTYYAYTINNGTIQDKDASGRITVLTIRDTEVNFGVNKALLDDHDRFRHLLQLTVSLGKVES